MDDEIDFLTQLQVAGYASTGALPSSAFPARVAERHDEFSSEAFWDANAAFLDRIERAKGDEVVETPPRYALLPALIAAARKHGQDWIDA